jgi:hypothetical protein
MLAGCPAGWQVSGVRARKGEGWLGRRKAFLVYYYHYLYWMEKQKKQK